jgi:hypothetical protein
MRTDDAGHKTTSGMHRSKGSFHWCRGDHRVTARHYSPCIRPLKAKTEE